MSQKEILVVLYNKKTFESKTLKSFAQANEIAKEFSMTIWNNGPNYLNSDEFDWVNNNFPNSRIIETIENIALSKIYNEFIKMTSSDYYAFFDDDSTLDIGFLCRLISFVGNGVAVPKVYHDEHICSPLVEGKFKNGPFKCNDKLVAIGSGVIISKEIIDTVRNEYGDVFDGRFGFYGVDYSFFLRLQEMNKINLISIIGDIQHSLSSYLKEDTLRSKFRRRERSIDYALQLRFYSKSKFLSVTKELVRFLFGKRVYEPHIVISYYIKGKHYKC
jgi:hypothetical protein